MKGECLLQKRRKSNNTTSLKEQRKETKIPLANFLNTHTAKSRNGIRSSKQNIIQAAD